MAYWKPIAVSFGMAVVATRVVALRAEPEMERALQTPTREQVQQDADKATYERRAVAVQRERAIAENDALWLESKELAHRTGWELKPQGRDRLPSLPIRNMQPQRGQQKRQR